MRYAVVIAFLEAFLLDGYLVTLYRERFRVSDIQCT